MVVTKPTRCHAEKYEKEKMKKTQKYMAILALVLPTFLGACGGSDSKSDSGSAELKAADLDVSVSCDDWAQVTWLWMIGNKKCGLGWASESNSNGVPYYLNVDANESGFVTKLHRITCAVLNGGPEATDIEIKVDIDNPNTSSQSNNPNTSSQSTTTTTQNSVVMLSSANITSLKQECMQTPGCSAVYQYFVDYINQAMDEAFISSKACFAFFRDMINVIAPGEWDPWLDWELLNRERCVVKAG